MEIKLKASIAKTLHRSPYYLMSTNLIKNLEKKSNHLWKLIFPHNLKSLNKRTQIA